MGEAEHHYSLKVRIADHGHCTVLTVSGRLDRVSAPVMTAYVDAVWDGTPGPHLVLDLRRVTGCDYYGAGVFAHMVYRAEQRPQAAIVLVGIGGRVQRMLSRTGLVQKFAHAASLKQACAALAAPPVGAGAAERQHLNRLS
ncbi:STAS domain-containing protein [Nonomuraea rubra]